MGAGGRILLSGGHEFNRRSGNDALSDLIVELTESSRPRICLLPTASGDATDQIARFRMTFGERGCRPSAISLFRLGTYPVDLRGRLMAQDAIYVGGGSLLNMLAIWRAHGLDPLLRECLDEGILICGQSAGAMCWFEYGITRSSGAPAVASGLGLLAGSACVHYGSDPARRTLFRRSVAASEIPPGLGLEDQTAVLVVDGQMTEVVSAREDARVWRVTPAPDGTGEGVEEELECRPIVDQRPAIDALSAEIVELRQTLAARAATRRSRRGVIGRLD